MKNTVSPTMDEGNKPSPVEGVSKSAPADAKGAQNQDDRRRAELEMKIRYRVACEAKAFDIVNRLIEETVSEEYLQECCRFIDVNHYADIVEERAIVHICGYPLCNRKLEAMPKKKYHISTKSNTVYDITERKNFCSNQCYKASKHLAKQVPDTPVWSREKDTIRKVCFLSTASNRGAVGEEVIGSHLFTLREELRVLESLDQLSSSDASRARGHASEVIDQTVKNRPGEASRQKHVVGSGNLSVSSSSKPTERSDLHVVSDDVSVKMAQLRLDSEGGRKVVQIHKKNPSSGDGCNQATEDVGLLTRKLNSLKVNNDNQHASSPLKLLPEMHAPQCADKTASITDSSSTADREEAVRAAVNSAVSDLAIPHSKLCQSQHTVDSDDDDDGENADGTTPESCIQSLSDDSGTPRKTYTEEFSLANKNCGNSCMSQPPAKDDHSREDDEQCIENSMTQKPGELQTEYIIRLLKRKKNLFSQMADVQSAHVASGHLLPPTSQVQTDTTPIEDSQSHSKLGSDQCEIRGSETADQKAVSANAICNKDSQDSTSFTAKRKARVDFHKSNTSALDGVCHILRQWITGETLALLGLSAGEDSVANTELGPMPGNPEMLQKYRDLSQRLAVREKDFEELGVEDASEEGTAASLQPVPNFKELKEKTQEYELRIREFYRGSQLPRSKKQTDGGDNAESVGADKPLLLPAVDSCNQLLIRRRIVLEQLDRVMPILLPPVGLSVQDVSSLLREMVFTFSLTNKNVVFRPAEWTLVGILLLKMLASKSSLIALALEKSAPRKSLDLVLQKLDHSSESLGNLVTKMLLDCKRQLQQNPC